MWHLKATIDSIDLERHITHQFTATILGLIKDEVPLALASTLAIGRA
jgi:hypothetical protein